MIKIAHRGLFEGQSNNRDLENKPEQIELALAKGFDAEVDLQVINNKLFLGHDTPDYEINESFLLKRRLWIHAKNADSLRYLATKLPNLNYFAHANDPVVITTHGWLWYHCYHLKDMKRGRAIAVMPEYTISGVNSFKTLDCDGICSDYVGLL
jgi:hypothetical protein